MPNILELQEDLKNFDDAQLSQALDDPAGSIPQYLVLTEMNRRKNIRDTAQMQEPKPQTTIAEELSGQMSPYGAPAPSTAPEVSAGFPALANSSKVTGVGASPTFAEGGYVFDPDNPFMGIAEQLGTMREDNARARANSKNLALAHFGFGMASSSSPFFGQAIGEGGTAGLNAYRQAQNDIAQRELDFLNENLALAQAQQGANVADQRMSLEANQLALREQELARAPANVRTIEWLLQQPKDVQDQFNKVFGSKTGSTSTLKEFDKASTIYSETAKDMLKPLDEGGGGWATKFQDALTDVEKARVQRDFNKAVYDRTVADNPARAEQFKAIYEGRSGLNPNRGLNILGTAKEGEAEGDLKTVPLSPLAGKRKAAPAGSGASQVDRTRALMEQIRKEQQRPIFERVQGQWG